jgi:hypothetical protein
MALVAIMVSAVTAVVFLSHQKSSPPENTTRGVPGATSRSTTLFTTTARSSSPRPTAPPSGRSETIADYIKQNNIQETMIKHDTPGAPTIDLPVPDGWTQLPESSDAPYGGIVFNTPADPNDPPKILAIMEKLTGNVDADKMLAVAPGELKNLPGYDGGDGEKNSLSGYPAIQLGGNYTKGGTQRVIAQKTVVIQAKDGGVYVLQLNAEGPEPDKTPLMAATTEIDDKTTITAS